MLAPTTAEHLYLVPLSDEELEHASVDPPIRPTAPHTPHPLETFGTDAHGFRFSAVRSHRDECERRGLLAHGAGMWFCGAPAQGDVRAAAQDWRRRWDRRRLGSASWLTRTSDPAHPAARPMMMTERHRAGPPSWTSRRSSDLSDASRRGWTTSDGTVRMLSPLTTARLPGLATVSPCLRPILAT